MADDRTLIEKRDEARRAYRQMLRRFLKVIDRHLNFLDQRKAGQKDQFRKIMEEIGK